MDSGKGRQLDAILKLEGVTKNFGEHRAVDRLGFEVPTGAVFGLLGPNGAGKSTTIRMIMRILMPDSGRILFDDRDMDDERRRGIGYLPEERGLYSKMKVLDQLVYLGNIRGVSRADAKRAALEWLERFGLGSWAQKKVEALSKGMQQKIQLIGAMIHQPRLLILDEPFSGLDPIVTRELKDLLLDMASKGVTVVLSTHVLPQVDELCSHICLINRARAILQGPLEEIRRRYGGHVWRLKTALGIDELEGLPGVRSVQIMGDAYLVQVEAGKADIFVREVALAGGMEELSRFVPDLENIFLRAVEEDSADVQ